MRAGKRRQRATTARQPTTALIDVLKRRLTTPDLRSHAQLLADMRDEQATPQLPAQTAELLDRLERAIASKAR